MQHKIRKAKLKDRTLEVELEEYINSEGGTINNTIIKKCGSLVHDDLIIALEKLKPHLVKICDFKKADSITPGTIEDYNLENLTEYKVNGFTIGGDSEHEGIVIIGCRTFSNGKVLNITTPFMKFSDDNEPYELAEDLGENISRCLFEIDEYLFNEKHAIKQLEMEFDEDMTDSEETMPEEPKKGSRKKSKVMEAA